MRKQGALMLLALFTLVLKKKNCVRKKNGARKTARQRRWWVREFFLARERHGAFHTLIQEMRLSDKGKYINYLRITPIQFENLVTLIGPSIRKVDFKRGIGSIGVHERIALTLRYLASGDSMVSMSYAFRIGKSTVSLILSETCQAIWEVMRSKVFNEPSQSYWLQCESEFSSIWQFPHCIGAVDGKHVVIQAPPNSGSQFYNYKGSHSIVLMAVCDAKYRFIAVEIGAQGRQSDGGVFRNSEIGKRLVNGQLNLPLASPLTSDGECGEPIPYFIVGDAAFPLSANLMRPYAGNFLPLHKRMFNYRLSRARRVSENTFGIMTARWRIFRKPIIASLPTTENIIKAITVLHNWIMMDPEGVGTYCPPGYVDEENNNGDIIPGEWRKETNLNRFHRVGSNMYKKDAEKIRENLALYFCSEGAVTFQWDK